MGIDCDTTTVIWVSIRNSGGPNETGISHSTIGNCTYMCFVFLGSTRIRCAYSLRDSTTIKRRIAAH